MRGKLRVHGDKVFATYELLEMLLYYVIPYRDTNPLASRLMKRFKSLDGVWAATKQELVSVEGIGDSVADFLGSVADIFSSFDIGALYVGEQVMTEECVADFFVKYFNSFEDAEERNKHRSVVAMLDNKLRLLGLSEIYNLDFGSGAVRSRPFIEAAISSHASTVILAHNHPFGPLFPSDSDRASNAMLYSDLAAANIFLAEHYIVCGNRCIAMMHPGAKIKLMQRNYGDGRYEKKTVSKIEDGGLKLGVLRSVLSLIMDKESLEKSVEILSESFARLCDVFSADTYVLKNLLGSERTAMFLKLVFSLFVRTKTDRFEFRQIHTSEQIKEYFTALLEYEPMEKVYIMTFDEKRRAISCDFVAEGTVDTSNLPPRRILEIAKRNEAKSVIIAHNHPGGVASPSDDDFSATVAVGDLLSTVGIELTEHYVISGTECCSVIDCALSAELQKL